MLEIRANAAETIALAAEHAKADVAKVHETIAALWAKGYHTSAANMEDLARAEARYTAFGRAAKYPAEDIERLALDAIRNAMGRAGTSSGAMHNLDTNYLREAWADVAKAVVKIDLF